MLTKLISYIKETRQELHKVNWPTRKETTQHTLLIIAISIGVAIFLGAFDYVYRLILQKAIF